MAINVDALNTTLSGLLEEYNRETVSEIKKLTIEAADELVAETKKTAPKGKRAKHYRDKIASRTLSENPNGIVMQWYVKGDDARLSHLLNDGHALAKGGRARGTNFIGKATDKVTEEFTKKVEEVIENG